MRHQGRRGIGAFLLAKLLHLIVAIVIPAFVITDISLAILLLTYLFSQMLASLIFVVLILGTHWSKATFIRPQRRQYAAWFLYSHFFNHL